MGKYQGKETDHGVYYIDAQTSQAIEGVHTGNLATNIKKTMQYSLTGVAVGAGLGILIATLTGKCRLCYGFWGAIGGAGVGYLMKPKNK